MKKSLIFICLVVLIVATAGCLKKEAPQKDSGTEPTPQEATPDEEVSKDINEVSTEENELGTTEISGTESDLNDIESALA